MGRMIGVGPNWYSNAAAPAVVWLQRHPVAVDAVTGTSSGTVDVTFAIPAAWDDFWDNVQSTANGYDIIVTGPDGRTILSFDLSGFSHTNRTCTVRIDGLVLAGTGKMEMVWLYWNSAQASSLGAVVTITSAISGYIELGSPPGYAAVVARPLVPGQTESAQFVQKSPSDVTHIHWDISDLLFRRDHKALYNDHTGYEGVTHCTSSVDPGATATVTAAQTRYYIVDDRLYVRTQHNGGATGTTESAFLTIVTQAGSSGSASRTLVCPVSVNIEDGV